MVDMDVKVTCLKAMKQIEQHMSPRDLASRLGLERSEVGRAMHALALDGELVRHEDVSCIAYVHKDFCLAEPEQPPVPKQPAATATTRHNSSIAKAIEILTNHGEPLSVSDIFDFGAFNSKKSLGVMMAQAADRGLLKRFKRGIYGLPNWPDWVMPDEDGGWIRVSHGLPSPCSAVLVTLLDDDGERITDVAELSPDESWSLIGGEDIAIQELISWQPLPPPDARA